MAQYLEIFFELPVSVQHPLDDAIVSSSARRTRTDGNEQLLAPFIMDSILFKNIPKDAIAVMGITAKDLYPGASWNYVFGLRSLRKRVGVISLHRFSSRPFDDQNYVNCLTNVLKTSSHEIGHMFGLKHCIKAICVMNGSNALPELEIMPNRLCSECLQKLSWNIGFKNYLRLLALKHFFKKHRLITDAHVTEKDIMSVSNVAGSNL